MPSARPLITLTPGLGQLARERAGEALARRRRRARADHRDGRARRTQRRARAAPRTCSRFGSPAPRWARQAGHSAAPRSSTRTVATHPSPAAARDQGERLGHVLARDAAALGEVGGRARQPQHAHLRGARSGAADAAARSSSSRASGAMPRRSSSASSRRALGIACPRAACQSRAPATRAATTSVASGRSRLSASGSGASTRTTRSRRSTSGPLRRAR